MEFPEAVPMRSLILSSNKSRFKIHLSWILLSEQRFKTSRGSPFLGAVMTRASFHSFGNPFFRDVSEHIGKYAIYSLTHFRLTSLDHSLQYFFKSNDIVKLRKKELYLLKAGL